MSDLEKEREDSRARRKKKLEKIKVRKQEKRTKDPPFKRSPFKPKDDDRDYVAPRSAGGYYHADK